MKTRIVASAIIERDGKFLFGRKAPGEGPYPDTWHLLGGGVRLEQETLEQGLRRELQEEARIEVGDLTPVFFDEKDSPNRDGEMTRYVFHVYRCTHTGGEPTPDDDIERLAWFTKEQIKTIPLPEPSQKLFRFLGWRE